MSGHFAIPECLQDYLQAVEESLAKARVAPSSRQEIRENLIAQFEEARARSPQLDPVAYVASLDDPGKFAEDWHEAEDTPVEPAVAQTARIDKRPRFGLWIVAMVLAALAGVSGFYLVRLRNEIVVSQATIKSSWAQVETMLQRRYDLIPNLVETVKGYAAHEKEVFEEVARARSQWATAQTPGQRQALAPQMEGALSRLLAVSEQYPNLKASEQFLALQYQLEGTENRIAVARTRYNDALREYNSQVQQFPANLLGFDLNEQFFEAVKEAGTAPKVSFQ